MFLDYFYVCLWAALAVAVAIIGRKEGLLAVAATAFFVFMAVWYGLRAFGGIQVFDGTPGIVFKVVLGVFAAVLLVVWITKRRGQK